MDFEICSRLHDRLQYAAPVETATVPKCYNALCPPILPDSIVSEVLPIQKSRKVLDERTRDIILNMLQMCKEESIKNTLIIPLSGTYARVAMYTNVSERTVSNIKKADQRRKEMGEAKRPLPKVKRPRYIKTILDDRDIIKIKNIIRDHYIKHRKVPVIRRLLPTILNEIPTYKNRINFLFRVLPNIGFKRKKYYSKRSVLIEDSSIVAYRNEYIKCMKRLKNSVEKVFYVYECIIDRSFTLHKSWVQLHGYNGALRDKNTLSFICAGSINGFLKNSLLLRRNDINITEKLSNPGQLTAHAFENWLKTNLIPNLPQNAVVVMDNGPHHCVEEDLPISYYTSKLDMCNYLKNKNIVCDENMRRSELYKLIELNKPKQKNFVVDSILKQHGHTAMRLPPYMIDLNPVQHAMDRVQQKLFEQESDCKFDIRSICEVLGTIMTSVTKDDWKMFFHKVTSLEEECLKKDEEYEVALDEVILSYRDLIDNESEESDFDSETEDLKM